MPRVPLQEINTNRIRGNELSHTHRHYIVGCSAAGIANHEIASTFEIPKQTVSDTINLHSQRNDDKSLSRSGAPKLASEQDERAILRFVRRFPKKTYRQIAAEVAHTLSRSTVYRLLKIHGITNGLCKKRPFLTILAVKTRRRWCRERSDWSEEQWRKIIFSDECSVERGAGAQREWAFRTPHQKWNKEMISTYKKGKDISVMIWGAIWIGGRSRVVLMERDPHSPRQGYSALSYVEIIREELPTCYEPGMLFM